MISNLVYHLLMGIVRLLQALPVRFVAGAGRVVGSIVHLLDGRHRWLAHENLRRCFPEMSDAKRTQVVREHFRRLGENFAAAIPTAGMSNAEIAAEVGMSKQHVGRVLKAAEPAPLEQAVPDVLGENATKDAWRQIVAKLG